MPSLTSLTPVAMPTIAREMGDGKRRVGEREESEREWWSREPERGNSKHDRSMN